MRSKLLLILAGTLIGILSGEVTLRLLGISYPTFYQADEQLGYSLRPGAEGWHKREGTAYIRNNSQGLRDREHSQQKPANTLRIAVLGDSFAQASQIPLEDTFWAVLEKELKRCPELDGRDVEVINFGVAGYGTAQELLMLRHRVWAYSPDLVILAVFTENDIVNNSRALQHDALRPYFVYEEGNLALDASFRNTSEFRTRSKVNAWSQVWESSRLLQAVLELQRITMARIKRARLGENSDRAIYREPADPVWREAWRVTEGLIVSMRDDVKDKGATLFVVTLSNAQQVDPNPAVRRRFMETLGVSDLFYPDSQIRALGEREGIPVLNLAPLMQTYAEEHRVFLHGFENSGMGTGHWNAEGHHLAGRLIARDLCGSVLIKFRDGLDDVGLLIRR